MILELDLGNTRIKWRILDQRTTSLAGYAHDLTELDRQVDSGKPLKRIRVSNVRGPGAESGISEWAAQRWRLVPEYARVTPWAAGVSCGYREPAQLGVDRWLAVVAAWNEFHQPCMVVDAGSAITLDIVDAGGVHRGGYIAPGLALMQRSLSIATAGARVDPSRGGVLHPASNTVDAVHNGCLAMAISFVAACCARMGPDHSVFMTGGDAPMLQARLQESCEPVAAKMCLRPELVLDGLSLVLP